ncbi:MAG: hypothetical protein NT062_27570 [Proteobacteria bacterium]|nr:hypothetical protein [Pseudomonadota bacterium]
MTFDRPRIDRLLARAAAQLDGEWLVVGGSVAAIWFAATRTTEDVDMFGLAGSNAERLALMAIAEDEGLPIEAISTTAEYFVRRIANWRDELVVLLQGRATIYRPSATLFLLLKARRLSATDLEDCLALIAHCRTSGEWIEVDRVRAELAALPAPATALFERRAALATALLPTSSS